MYLRGLFDLVSTTTVLVGLLTFLMCSGTAMVNFLNTIVGL